MRPLQHHTWDTFNRNWEVDVRQAFHWIREALLLPLAPQSTVIALSSGAALFGSPLSGGYAGAKATIRFITAYGADESSRAGLGIRFISLRRPPPTPHGPASPSTSTSTSSAPARTRCRSAGTSSTSPCHPITCPAPTW
jgi:NAD(P)-dependent dehydrogenase (short-subunit alcohol dehydrogenase family)